MSTIDQRVRELYLPTLYPPKDYQYEKSLKYRRKRRSINPTFMPELRILRHDIRRKYGEMFVNVTNSCDLVLMRRLFGEFVRPDCVIDCGTPKSNIYHQCHSTNSGDIERFLHAFAMTCEMMPDHVLRLQECQVRTRQGAQGSIVILTTLATCGQPFNPNSLQIQRTQNKLKHDRNDNHNNSSSTLHIPQSDSSNESSQPLLLPLSLNKAGERYELTLAPNPVEIVASICFILVLDENHFIRQMIIENKLISERIYQ